METQPEQAMTAYTQEDGEITAWLTDNEEKTALSHEGSPPYVRALCSLVAVGLIYLLYVFLAY